ncbi:MAG: glycosyltransferase family 39 protein [Chthoniobacterales bacterium]
MAAATRTYSLHETLLGAPALPPPPTRHALFVFLIALAAILHFGTAGWSEIHNGREGVFAGGARQLLRGNAEPPQPTLLHWLIVGSYKLFGVRPATARFPIAAAMVASVALTFLIGERLAGYWRGFAAGLIHLCSLGAFIWGRIITPQPLFAVFLGGAIYCAVCAYQRQRKRRWWLGGVLVFLALTLIGNGVIGLLYPLIILALLAASFREARMRFAQVHWLGVLIAVVCAALWSFWLKRYLHVWPDHSLGESGLSPSLFLKRQLAWSLPATIMILPGVCFALRKILRPYEFDFADAVPLYWMAVGFLPLIFFSHRQDADSIPMWGGFALWAACAWDRMPRRFRLIGLGLAGAVGLALALVSGADLSHLIPIATGRDWRSILLMAGLPLLVAALLAGYFALHDREMLALAVVMLGAVPMGLSAAETMARLGPQFSLATAAQFLAPRLEESGEVLYEGSATASSSLTFYLEKNFSLLRDEDAALEKMSRSHPVFLIIHKDRVPYWQDRLTERFHIYHQETTCGPHVVVANDLQLKN